MLYSFLTTVVLFLNAQLALGVSGPWTCSDQQNGCLLNNTYIMIDGETLVQPAIIDTTATPNIEISVQLCKNSAANFANWTSRCYCYKGACSVPGPTIKMTGGSSFSLKLTNKLTLQASDADGQMMNVMHSPDIVNLHTHGLHSDPEIDSIFISIAPGSSHTYNYELPSDHAPGLNWYHSHLHGTTALQAMGGLVGAVDVQPPPGFTTDPSIAAMARSLLVFTHIDLSEGVQTRGDGSQYDDPFTCWTYTQFQQHTGDLSSANVHFAGPGNVADAYLTNGQYQPQHSVMRDEFVIFDMLNAVGDRILEIELRSTFASGDVGTIDANYAPNPDCEVYLLAMDGVYLSEARRTGFTNHLMLVQAQRASIAVKCTKAGTYFLQSTYSGDVQAYEVATVQNLLTLQVSDRRPATPMAAPNLAGTTVSDLYADLRNTPATGATTLSLAVEQTAAVDRSPAMFWLGLGTDCQMVCFGRSDCDSMCDKGGACDTGKFACDGSDGSGSCINGEWAGVQSYSTCTYQPMSGEQGPDGSYAFVGQVGDVYDFEIWGRGKSAHPMHLHTNKFQIVEYVNGNGDPAVTEGVWGKSGDWRDVMPAWEGVTHLKMRLADYGGEIAAHCHYLKHEDLGMMGTLWYDAA